MLDKTEFERWFKSAEITLKSARKDLSSNDYNWACFKSQQAAEKALKAILWGIGEPVIGHTLKKLIDAISKIEIKVDERIYDNCVELSKYYITTRYPDVWSEGLPEEYFTENEAKECIRKSEEILEWVKKAWNRLSTKEGRKEKE